MYFKKRESAVAKTLPIEEQEAKINEVRKIIGPVVDRLQPSAQMNQYQGSSEQGDGIQKKAAKMFKDILKWRMEYKPEKIRWEHVAKEVETGKIYRANYLDKTGRTVLVMCPGFQVRMVICTLEIELGGGWIIHKLLKDKH